MRKRQLEILLQRVRGFPSPSAAMEQYMTPPSLASDLLHIAHMRDELSQVLDLGCGTGILAIGAALLGARAYGVDIDPQALRIARENAEMLGVHVDFILGDIERIAFRRVKTVIMNPPFGAQHASRGDRAFLRRAVEIADVIYTIHNAGSLNFVRSFVSPCRVEEVYKARIPIKRMFDFHRKDVEWIEVELYRIVCKQR
ncbi:MAG: METTL5 family protein [Methanothrix sp.]|uniref:METTL5 family protein n=1 Tax=Methanothrix sp. TaxID=90426 RepID=UPI0031673E02|nr:METTL5 family protein [Methanothrix sp.]